MEEEIARIEARANSLVETHTEHLRELVALRYKHELSQADVAERMGVSQPTVAAFEHYDSNPTLTTIRRYALAVGGRLKIEVLDDCADHNDGAFQEIVSGISAGTSFKAQPAGPVVKNRAARGLWKVNTRPGVENINA